VIFWLLKLGSDRTDSVGVDLHQQRLNGDGRLLSLGHVCGPLAQPKDQEPPFKDFETSAAVGQLRSYARIPETGRSVALSTR